MKKIVCLFVLVLALFTVNITVSSAQCAMCSINAEQGVENGNTQAKGLNAGVLFLLAAPFVMMGGVGFLWYRKYKNSPAQNAL